MMRIGTLHLPQVWLPMYIRALAMLRIGTLHLPQVCLPMYIRALPMMRIGTLHLPQVWLPRTGVPWCFIMSGALRPKTTRLLLPSAASFPSPSASLPPDLSPSKTLAPFLPPCTSPITASSLIGFPSNPSPAKSPSPSTPPDYIPNPSSNKFLSLLSLTEFDSVHSLAPSLTASLLPPHSRMRRLFLSEDSKPEDGGAGRRKRASRRIRWRKHLVNYGPWP